MPRGRVAVQTTLPCARWCRLGERGGEKRENEDAEVNSVLFSRFVRLVLLHVVQLEHVLLASGTNFVGR